MIKGDIVGLRAIEEKDLGILLEWRNKPDYRVFFREFRELNYANQQQWFQKYVLENINTLMFAIVEIKSGELIGACGLCSIDWINRNAELSIYIGKNEIYIDEYFAKETLELLEKYSFEELNLHRLWAEVYSVDKKKIDLFHNLNFVQEGLFKETHWTSGVWVDSFYFGKILQKR